MPIGLLKDIINKKPENTALLGLDVGKKTIGLALSNPEQTLATPLRTINRSKFARDMQAIQEIIDEYEVGGFVIGYPLNMDGSEGPRAQSVRDFAIEMKNILGSDPWIALWDERLSTVSVESFVDKIVDKRKTKTNAKGSGLIDKLAAQIILQGALEFNGS
ncbi:MAG: Holliday junction resolvase RuvX [Alphaproteobacteria bacterium]|nr:Holliday junction resolvase RuvX [Alphaproteobacteria bacterium]